MAPPTALMSAFKIGQSLTASVPSFIPSVSRLGEATEPESRVVAPDHDRGFDYAFGYQIVEHQPGPDALAVAQPANAGGQPLHRDALFRHLQPAVQVLVFGEHLHNGFIGAVNVLWVTGERPPSGTAPCPRRTVGGYTLEQSRENRKRS